MRNIPLHTSLHFVCEWHIPVTFLLNFIICLWHPPIVSFKSSFEFSLAKSNVNILSSWVKSTINHSKTKYMIISRKFPTSFITLPSLLLDGSPLELVSSFKYLGVTLTYNLSWSIRINETCSKAKNLLGYIYRQYVYRIKVYLITWRFITSIVYKGLR